MTSRFLPHIITIVGFWLATAGAVSLGQTGLDLLAPVDVKLPGGNSVRVVKSYPEGRMRASCQSFDDGTLGSDWPVLDALNKRGIPATFFINSTHPQSKDAVKFPKRYAGHEIASHGANHKGLPGMTGEQVAEEIQTDQRILGEAFGQPVIGFAYPYGSIYKEEDKQFALETQLRGLRLIYARGVRETKAYIPPPDFIRWNPDCGLMDRIDKFLAQPAGDSVRVRMCFAHSIDFARGVMPFDTWLGMLDQLAAEPSIWNVTLRDYALYITALRALKATDQGLQNNSDLAVWAKVDGRPREIAPRTTLRWSEIR
jgi:peptidoglycan/xylan/chitin deacetylase (PgdA/CDA1 family)